MFSSSGGFGSSNSSGFGQNQSGFGQPQNNSGNGGFGQPQNTPFGSSGGFGSTNTFGSNQNSSNSFSTSNSFGNSGTGGGFGSSSFSNNSSGGFGGGNAGGFGNSMNNNQPQTTSSFGSSSFSQPQSTFGNANNNTNNNTFGGSSFGSSFGSSMQPQGNNSFGNSSFRQPQNSGNAFGSSSNTFGNANNNNNSGFSSNSFGSSGTSGNTGGFGFGGTGSSTFGQPQNTSSFGAQPNNSSFGSSSFGASNQSSVFGSSGQNQSSFGAPAPINTTLNTGNAGFGQNQNQSSMFGGSQPQSSFASNSFGASNNNNSFGGFQGGSNNATMGTRGSPYVMTEDSSSGTAGEKFVAISAMANYQLKSLEMLRWEDYQSGSGNNTQSTMNGGGMMGNNTFGSQPSTGAFGQSNTMGGLGGNNTQSSGASNIFGSSASTFGAPAPTGGGSSLFGASQPQQPAAGSMFGSSNTSGAFGTPNNTLGGFGQPAAGAPAGTGLMSQNSGSSLFGASSNAAPQPQGGGLFAGGTTGFGATASNSGNIFGSNTTTNSAFASTTTNAFGAPAAPASTSLFGSSSATVPTQSSSFQLNSASTPSLTGGGVMAQPSASSSMFGGSTAGGMFTQSQQPVATSNIFGGGSVTQPTSMPAQGMILGPGMSSTGANQQFPAGTATSGPYASGEDSQVAKYINLAREAWQVVPNTKQSESRSANESLDKVRNIHTPVAMRSRGFNRVCQAVNSTPSKTLEPTKDVSKVLSSGIFDRSKPLSINKANRDMVTPRKGSISQNGHVIPHIEDQERLLDRAVEDPNIETPSKTEQVTPRQSHPRTPDGESPLRGDTEENPESTRKIFGRVSAKKTIISHYCPTMSDEYVSLGYNIHPSMSDLQDMTDEQLAAVKDFAVSRVGYGRVQWLGAVDVRNLVVEHVVEISDMSIEVYFDESETPPRGTKLNRPAICTIEHMKPPDDFDGDFELYLAESLCPQLDAKMIDYDQNSRTWMFQVKHFTKYGFDASSTSYPSTRKRANESVRVSSPAMKLDFDHDPVAVPRVTSPVRPVEISPVRNQKTFKISESSKFTRCPNLPIIPSIHRARLANRDVSVDPDAEVRNCFNGTTVRLAHDTPICLRHARRSFSVSWGPRGEIVYSVGNRVHIQRVHVGAQEKIEDQRLNILRNACDDTFEYEDDKTKFAVYSLGALGALNVHEHLAWTLIRHLWFDGFAPMPNGMTAIPWTKWVDALPRTNGEVVECQAALELVKRHSITTWLEYALKTFLVPSADTDITQALSCGAMAKAAEIAMQQGNYMLATMISSGPPHQSLRDQHSLWTKGEMSPELKNIYNILGGIVLDEQKSTAVCHHWLRAFTLDYLYGAQEQDTSECSSTEALSGQLLPQRAPLESRMRIYFARTGLDKPKPRRSWYSESQDHRECFDTLFCILCAAVDPLRYDLRRVVDRSGHSPIVLNNGFMWMLSRVLGSMGLFNVALDEAHDAMLSMSYIQELETIGQWHYGVFVAQFLPDLQARYACTVELLERHIQSEESLEIISYLTEKVRLPSCLLNHSRAHRAMYEGKIDLAVDLITKAMVEVPPSDALFHGTKNAIVKDYMTYVLTSKIVYDKVLSEDNEWPSLNVFRNGVHAFECLDIMPEKYQKLQAQCEILLRYQDLKRMDGDEDMEEGPEDERASYVQLREWFLAQGSKVLPRYVAYMIGGYLYKHRKFLPPSEHNLERQSSDIDLYPSTDSTKYMQITTSTLQFIDLCSS